MCVVTPESEEEEAGTWPHLQSISPEHEGSSLWRCQTLAAVQCLVFRLKAMELLYTLILIAHQGDLWFNLLAFAWASAQPFSFGNLDYKLAHMEVSCRSKTGRHMHNWMMWQSDFKSTVYTNGHNYNDHKTPRSFTMLRDEMRLWEEELTYQIRKNWWFKCKIFI